MQIHSDSSRTYRTCNNCPSSQFTPEHIYDCPAVVAVLFKVDIDTVKDKVDTIPPKELLYLLKLATTLLHALDKLYNNGHDNNSNNIYYSFIAEADLVVI